MKKIFITAALLLGGFMVSAQSAGTSNSHTLPAQRTAQAPQESTQRSTPPVSQGRPSQALRHMESAPKPGGGELSIPSSNTPVNRNENNSETRSTAIKK